MLRKRHLALRHRPFERVRATWQVEIGVSDIERISLGFLQGYALETSGSVQGDSRRGSISASKAPMCI